MIEWYLGTEKYQRRLLSTEVSRQKCTDRCLRLERHYHRARMNRNLYLLPTARPKKVARLTWLVSIRMPQSTWIVTLAPPSSCGTSDCKTSKNLANLNANSHGAVLGGPSHAADGLLKSGTAASVPASVAEKEKCKSRLYIVRTLPSFPLGGARNGPAQPESIGRADGGGW